jgi:hypothetical protein
MARYLHLTQVTSHSWQCRNLSVVVGMMSAMNLGRKAFIDPYLQQQSRAGVIRALRLEQLGVPQSTTYRRCLPGGPWTHLLPGIVLLGRANPTARQRVEAALLHAASVGVVTGFEAACRYGLVDVPTGDTVHMLIPATHHIRSAGFALIERTVHMPEARNVGGVPLASPPRAVLDGVRRVRDLNVVRALLINAKQSGLCTQAQLTAELEAGSQRGTALPRAVLRELDENVWSVPEADALTLWRRSGLPSAMRNVKIFDTEGRYIATPDVWCDEVALAMEIDSFNFHFKRSDYARTVERNSRYAAAGIVLFQVLPVKIRDDPRAVIRDLQAAYEAAKKRPRPNIRVATSQAA